MRTIGLKVPKKKAAAKAQAPKEPAKTAGGGEAKQTPDANAQAAAKAQAPKEPAKTVNVPE